MLKVVGLVLASVLLCYGAPNKGKVKASVEGSVDSGSCEINVTAQANYLEASLYLYAPQTWVDSYQQIPEEEVECFLGMANDKSVVFSAQDEQFFNQLKDKCPNGSDKLIAFFNQINSTISSLPTNLLNSFQAFKTKMEDIQNRIKTQSPTNKFNPAIAQEAGQGFTDLIKSFSSLSTEDKSKFAEVFPKLSPFITGDKAQAYLTDLSELLDRVQAVNQDNSTGNIDALKSKFETFKNDYSAVVTEFLSQNQDGVSKASEIAGVDFAEKLKEGLNFGAWAGGVPSEGNSFQQMGEQAQGDMLYRQSQASDKAQEAQNQMAEAGNQAKEQGSSFADKMKSGAEVASNRFSNEASRDRKSVV